MFITKNLKKEIDYLSHKRDICQQKVIHFNERIKPLKRKFQSLKLFNECKIVSKDLLHIRNFNFIPGWSHYDINGNIVLDSSDMMTIQNLYSNFFLKTVGKIIISYKHDYNSYYLSLILKNKPNIHNRFSDDLIRLVNSFMEPEEIMFYVHYSRTNSYENRYYPHESWGSGIKCENSFFGCEFDLDDSADEIIWEGQEHYQGRNSCTYLINKILNGINGEYEKIMQL